MNDFPSKMNVVEFRDQSKHRENCVFECDHPGKPLVISFSFAHWDKPCTFDFYGRLKKLEGLLREPFNRIYLRDPKSRWYHYGIDGLGSDVNEVAMALKEKIDFLQPSEVITIGQSMGGYAALVFGALLEADKVVAFAPQAFIDASLLESYNDRRYTTVLREICDSKLESKYLDIVTLYQHYDRQPKVHVFFGTKGGDSEAETVHLDALHAFKLQQLSNCQLHPYPEVDHLIVNHLSNTKEIDHVLLQLLFDVRILKKDTAVEPSSGWQKWIFNNLFSGCKVETLIEHVSAGKSSEKQAVISALHASGTNGYIQAAKEMKYVLDKRNWLINTYDQLASMGEGYSSNIAVRKTPDFKTFIKEHYSKHLPVVLTHGVDHWPALSKWSPQYFADTFGHKEVEIQLGRSEDPHYELNASKYKKKMLLGEYCQMVTHNGDSNDYYLTANNNKESLGNLVGLFDDVGDFGKGYRDKKTLKSRSHLWFGPKGVFTSLHHDLTNNMLVQIYGRKKITLFPAFQVPKIYNDQHVYSAAGYPVVDKNKFPLMNEVTPIEIVLHPGEAIFIPIGWWHCVEGIDVSMSISFTDFNARNDFFKSFPRIG